MATEEEVSQLITDEINTNYGGDIQAFLEAVRKGNTSGDLDALEGAIAKFRLNMQVVTEVGTDALNDYIQQFQNKDPSEIPSITLLDATDDKAKIINLLLGK